MIERQQSRRRSGIASALNDRTVSDVGHLLRRAGFGTPQSDVVTAAHRGLKATVDDLVGYTSVSDDFTPPPDAALSADQRYNTIPLAAWWLGRMIATVRPLQEKMTLFWHGHFATANYKVHDASLMYQQNQLFRSYALARFDDLLSAIYKDPAMLIWLDGARNTKFAPNENWGREVLELFTLGHGNYTEDDVHACSRAFTGWRVTPDGQAVFVPRLFDDSVKTLLGETGAWTADDAVRILAANPTTGKFLATKLWHFFASDEPSSSTIRTLAHEYTTTDHSIEAMVHKMFLLPEFYSRSTRLGHIKSPVEFVVETIRQMGLTNIDLTNFPRVLAFLGQELFNPPNVGGWPGGLSWINAATMLGRFNFASSLTGDQPSRAVVIDPQAVLAASGADRMDQLVSYITGNLGITMSSATSMALFRYAGRGSVDRPDIESKVKGIIHLALVSPEYQAS